MGIRGVQELFGVILGVGMAPPHGILINNKYVLPTVVGGLRGEGVLVQGGWVGRVLNFT